MTEPTTTATIDPSARLGAGTTVGEHVVIGPGVTLGEGCAVGHHVVIHAGTQVGSHVRIDEAPRKPAMFRHAASITSCTQS